MGRGWGQGKRASEVIGKRRGVEVGEEGWRGVGEGGRAEVKGGMGKVGK